MKKILKILGIVLAILLLVVFIFGLVVHEKRPLGVEGIEADQMADRMLSAVRGDAWQETDWLGWTFVGGHDYVWHKARNLVQVRWEDNSVLINTKTSESLSYADGAPLDGKDAEKAYEKAWKFFCNDSYWLNPIVKIYDPGVVRSKVQLKDGREALMITHQSGGTTPGDSYAYILDADFRPNAWKMWVGILPIGGIETSWEGWHQLEGGAFVSTVHEVAGKKVEMITDVRAGETYRDLGLEADPFTHL